MKAFRLMCGDPMLVAACLWLGTGVAVAQQAPVPILKKSNPTVSGLPQSMPVTKQRPAGATSMAGAKRCEQVGNQITCDNGYRTTVK